MLELLESEAVMPSTNTCQQCMGAVLRINSQYVYVPGGFSWATVTTNTECRFCFLVQVQQDVCAAVQSDGRGVGAHQVLKGCAVCLR